MTAASTTTAVAAESDENDRHSNYGDNYTHKRSDSQAHPGMRIQLDTFAYTMRLVTIF